MISIPWYKRSTITYFTVVDWKQVNIFIHTYVFFSQMNDLRYIKDDLNTMTLI